MKLLSVLLMLIVINCVCSASFATKNEILNEFDDAQVNIVRILAVAVNEINAKTTASNVKINETITTAVQSGDYLFLREHVMKEVRSNNNKVYHSALTGLIDAQKLFQNFAAMLPEYWAKRSINRIITQVNVKIYREFIQLNARIIGIMREAVNEIFIKGNLGSNTETVREALYIIGKAEQKASALLQTFFSNASKYDNAGIAKMTIVVNKVVANL